MGNSLINSNTNQSIYVHKNYTDEKYLFPVDINELLSTGIGQYSQSNLLFGVAYYDEYMPYDRIEKDIKMMKEAGINVVRIAESTWSTMGPQDTVFDYSHIDRVLNAIHTANIKVIIGTPTYAVPAWLVKKYPSVLATTSRGQNRI